jgi:hypothetical protein
MIFLTLLNKNERERKNSKEGKKHRRENEKKNEKYVALK